MEGSMKADLRIGYFTAQPSSLDPFHGFDPDSYTAITACHDSLTRLGENGELEPALAKEWRRLDPLTVEFTLREGVKFHNGEDFNAEAVAQTIAAQRNPENKSPTGLGILASIKKAEVIDTYRVRLITEYPDGMLLWRLSMFSDIVPPKALAEHGVDFFKHHPIGTGPFIFDSMEEGKYIRYVRNPNYWRGAPEISAFRFVIMPAPNWVEALTQNQLDLVYGLHAVQVPLLERRNDILLKSRLVALTHWFLLASKGPLLDKRVRLALNYAIDNYMLAKIQGNDNAVPQRAVSTAGQFGHNSDTMVFPFDPDKARKLLRDAGYAGGFTLKGIVADHSVSLVQMIAAYLADVKVKLEYEVVPRTVWMGKIPNARMGGAGRYEGDFAVAPVDNPTMHAGFHHYILLSSDGPFSLLNDENYQHRFLDAMTDIEDGEQKLKELDQYVHYEALLLFTIQSSVQVASRRGVEMKITKNGHFDNFSWQSLRDNRPLEKRPEWQRDYLESEEPIPAAEFRKVLEATEYSSDLFYFPNHQLKDPRLEKMVTNLNHQQEVKLSQEKLRFEQIVQYLNKTRDMEGVLNASRFSGIANYNADGVMVLCNPAFLELFGDDIRKVPLQQLFTDNAAWESFVQTLASEGGLFGSIDLVRSNGTLLQTQAACTLRKGSAGENIGYLLIVRDESEERTLRQDLDRSYREMEEKVVVRTGELQKSLEQVERLKQMQDGDYFLTTLLLEPLGLNSVNSESFSVEAFSLQKKKFMFKKREYEIGGDLNIAYTLFLRKKKYTLVLNADAMGKSIQGAGGILVLGSLMRAIIERTKISPIEREFYPERWLKNALSEMQLVFESFNGSMFVSTVVGLLEEETGCFYFANAEHPTPVILRKGQAKFLSQKATLRKLGISDAVVETRVQVFRLQADDILILGSDGKDDLLLNANGTMKKVNEDETLFLRTVEEAHGDMSKIVERLRTIGEVMDDVSLLRIIYHPAGENSRLGLADARRRFQDELVAKKAKDNTGKTLPLLEAYVREYPDDSPAIAKMGVLYKRMKLVPEAIDCFERLRLRDQLELNHLQSLADLYAYSGNMERAVRILDECIALDQTNAQTRKLQEEIESRLQAS